MKKYVQAAKAVFFILIAVVILGVVFGGRKTRADDGSSDFTITVAENALGGDGTFNFHLAETSPDANPVADFSITTSEGGGTHVIEAPSGNDTIFSLDQDPVSGWGSPDISCATQVFAQASAFLSTSPDALNEAQITGIPGGSITCNVTNTYTGSGKTPVLIVPGVLGTDIYDGSEKLWLDLVRTITNPDVFLDPLQFNADLNPSNTNLTTGDILGAETLNLGNNQNVLFDYSAKLVQEFENQGYTEGIGSDATLFTFPYDWRYGATGIIYGTNETNVDLLQQKISQIMAQTGSDKVDIVAHSTGGLIVKKYVMDNPTDNHIGKAVFVGVPEIGAPNAAKELLTGDHFGVPLLNEGEMQKIGANLPVVYDLLPSQQYFNEAGNYITVISQNLIGATISSLGFANTNSFLTNDHGFNATALTNAQNLHTAAFDNFDMRTAGVDMYAIDGCKTGTLAEIDETRYPALFGFADTYGFIKPDVGDGTVPIASSTNLPIDAGHEFFALDADHAKMLSADGSRQEIVNLISGSSLPVSSTKITQDVNQCQLNGKMISVYSPLATSITDQSGDYSGIASDGVSIQNDIPGAMYEVMGEHKFIYLPYDGGQTYSISLQGTGAGTFTLKESDIVNSAVTGTQVFSDAPVTASLKGTLAVASAPGSPATLSLDTNGDGTIDTILAPNSTVSAAQSNDVLPPTTTATVSGTEGQPGFYRSTVSIKLAAADPTDPNYPAATSGILKTNYAIDGGAYVPYASAITVSAEGAHTITFFSTDKAGNNEDPKTLSFTVDKTAPEISAQFNPSIQDLRFTGIDAISTGVNTTVVDGDDTITATDQAGNQTKLVFKSKNRKIIMAADIKSLSYDGVAADVSKNLMAFLWTYDKNKNLSSLSQTVQSKNNYGVLAFYDGKKTNIVGRDAAGIILTSVPGLDLLKVTTQKGDLVFSY